MLPSFFLGSLFTNFHELNSPLDKSRFAMMTRETAARDGNPLSLIGDAVEARSGTALEWWTAEMSPAEKRLTTFGESVDEWATLLIARFKEPATVAIDAVLRERYTMRDAAARREPREYAQKILRSAKDAGMTLVKNQVEIIYSGIDLELRRSDAKNPTMMMLRRMTVTWSH
ncbi:hypothetical protein BDR22DRAFT_872332 [Usnea florida]